MRHVTGRVGGLFADREIARLMALALVVVLVFSLTTRSFFTLINFQSMGFQVAEVGLLSLAVMLSMLTGGIDLSIVSVAGISAVVTTFLSKAADTSSQTGPLLVAETAGFIILGVLAGTACGVMNGLLVTRLRIPPILATLGTMQLLNGVAIIVTGGKAVYGLPDILLDMGNGTIVGVPIPLLVLLVAATLTAVFINRTGMGLRLKLVGANPVTARYSGLDNDRVLMATYVASALLASTAGIVIGARSAAANADYGASYVLLAIVIVVLGGVNPNGGSGTVGGVLLAAFTLQMISSGFNQVGLNSFIYLIAQGGILVTVIALTLLSGRFAVAWPRRRRGPPASGPTEPPPSAAPSAGGEPREWDDITGSDGHAPSH